MKLSNHHIMRFSTVVVQAAFLFQYQDSTNYLSFAFSSPNVASRPSSPINGQYNDIKGPDIRTNDNAFVNNNAADRGLGRDYVCRKMIILQMRTMYKIFMI